MSEIKSTLDLVMERTKNLTMNEAEKENQRKADIQKHLNGLIQKFQDQTIKPAEIFKRLDELKNAFGRSAEKEMVALVLKRVDVAADNDSHLTLLKEYFGLEVSPLKKILTECDQTLGELKNNRIDMLRVHLSDRYGISGTAVIPNIETDPDWPQECRRVTERFRIELEIEKRRLAFH